MFKTCLQSPCRDPALLNMPCSTYSTTAQCCCRRCPTQHQQKPSTPSAALRLPARFKQACSSVDRAAALPGGSDPSGRSAAGAQSRFLGVWYPFLAAALATLAGVQLTLPAQFAARTLIAPAGQLGPALAQLGGACALLPCAALHTLAVRRPALARPAHHPGVAYRVAGRRMAALARCSRTLRI